MIANEKAWNKTVLIVTFDEPVGSFDHVPPPAATPPWGSGTSPVTCEEDFKFDRYGARVPTLLISPLIEKGTVFRSTTGIPYDHTSLIATLLKWCGSDDKELAKFGERARHAPTFENVLTRTGPRRDARDVAFLDAGGKDGEVVKYHERFCLRSEDGRYMSSFAEDRPGWAWVGGWFEDDPAFTEYFPRMSSEPARRSELYFVNAEDRADAGPIRRETSATKDARVELKLVSVDAGLGSYSVLGVWGDSQHCYYSNDYIQEPHDRQERWRIAKADSDPDTRRGELRYGQQITI